MTRVFAGHGAVERRKQSALEDVVVLAWLAGPPGFEPGLTDPESAGLPLPHGPVGGSAGMLSASGECGTSRGHAVPSQSDCNPSARREDPLRHREDRLAVPLSAGGDHRDETGRRSGRDRGCDLGVRVHGEGAVHPIELDPRGSREGCSGDGHHRSDGPAGPGELLDLRLHLEDRVTGVRTRWRRYGDGPGERPGRDRCFDLRIEDVGEGGRDPVERDLGGSASIKSASETLAPPGAPRDTREPRLDGSRPVTEPRPLGPPTEGASMPDRRRLLRADGPHEDLHQRDRRSQAGC